MYSKKRLEWVDIAKGIAIFLVVTGHMLRGFTSSGMYSNYNSLLKYIDFTIYSFHVPLFFLASGLIYSYKTTIETKGELIEFIKRKCKILIIPYIIFSWLQLGVKIIMSGSVNHKVSVSSFFKIVYKPVEQFWFLYALLLIFIIVAIMDYKIKSDRVKLVVSLILYILSPYLTSAFEIHETCKYLIFFYIGRFFVKKEIKLNVFVCTMLYFITNLAFYCFNINNNILNLIIALIGIVMILSISKSLRLNIFSKLGKYTMPIFLLHTIFGSGIRIILLKIGIANVFIQVVLGLIFGIFIPIISYKFYKYGLEFINKNIKLKSINSL